MRVKYFSQSAIFSSFDSSDKSSMCELSVISPSLSKEGDTHEKSGSLCSLKYASSAASIPSNQGRSFFAQWSE